uniref:Calcium uniporter protein n=1 Tax=Haemonchus contortus TaxID=6289 RepID=W6NBL7_HAECO
MGGFFSTASSNVHSDLYAELEKTRIERQLAIAQLLEQRRRAYKFAEEREKLNWSASGGGLMMVFCAVSSYHHKNILHLLPVFPTLTYLGYKAHYCYGNKANTIRDVADKLLHDNVDLMSPAPISVQDVRNRMVELKETSREEEMFL